MSTPLKTTAPTKEYPFAGLQTASFCKGLDEFLRTPSYIVLLGFLSVFSVMRSLELITYTIFILIGIFVVLLGSDLLPLVPLVVLSYISPSIENNPGLNGNSVFSGVRGIYLLSIAGIFALCLLIRLFTDPQIGRNAFLKTRRNLLSGMLLLGAGYVLAGAFSGYYTANGWRNLLFGLIQFAAVAFFYILFTGGVRWENAPREYLAWSGICAGLVLLAQLCHIYQVNHVIVGGKILRDRIYSGWGTYNNIGSMLTMFIPFAFQLACRKKHSWVFQLIGLMLLVGVVMTCSRGSLLVAVPTYGASCVLMLRRAPRGRTFRLVYGVLLLAAVFAAFLFRNELLTLFRSVLDRGLDPGGREITYWEGLKQYFRFPLFGGGFFPVDYSPYDFSSVAGFSAFFPPRWHNTVIQLLASCGTVGLLAYGYHRYQTVKLLLKAPTTEKLYIAISILTLLATSMLDCHFFNVGPTLFYSMALAFGEKTHAPKHKQVGVRR